MSVVENMRTWWQMQTGEEETPFDGDSGAFIASLIFHCFLLLALGLIPLVLRDHQVTLTVSAPIDEVLEEELKVHEDFAVNDRPTENIGANSVGDFEMAMSLAAVVSDVSDVPSPIDLEPTEIGNIEVNNEIQIATGLNFSKNMTVRGATGQGVTGASGAIDRLTEEILRSLDERKTLVVWMFDQSGSLARQRQAINNRFDRIYEELGVIEASGNPAFAKHEDKPLLTSVIAFGQNITLLTEKETDNLAEIKSAVDGIVLDESGTEKVFSAVFMAADRYKHYRMRDPVTDKPERNVMLIAFTDERGDDLAGMETTIDICQRYGTPAYVVGVPAPFGREETLMKYVDPDPQYDQTPGWGRVNQGPESLMPERVKAHFCSTQEDIDPIDSGFGPFALTRLCYETGGIFFAVHPNRNVYREVSEHEIDVFSSHLKYFFDPQVMRHYKPAYVSPDEYMRQAAANKARAALVTAAKKSWLGPELEPDVRFVKRSDAALAQSITKAKNNVAKLGPLLSDIHGTLRMGEADREKETAPRWQAGYDLAMGQTLASMLRAQIYNALLDEVGRGKPFEDPRNNTWRLVPTNDITLDGQSSTFATQAKDYLQRVVDEHPDTPWALLAKYELDRPFGWQLIEDYTDLTPRRAVGAGGRGGGGAGVGRGVAGGAAPARPVRRPVPKL